jgi:ribosomal protein S18 acetylase RimI-like enzyme/predicted nucleic acid-binding protein
MSTSLAVQPVAPKSKELSDVFALYRTHSRTLGFLPEGAFDEYAAEGHVLDARIDGALAGYVAYRVARSTVVIVHLCVSRDHRKRGVAHALIGALLEAEADVATMRLSCRHDYQEANRLWPRLGFNFRGERAGRGADSSRLFCWERRTDGDLPLLQRMQEAELEDRKRVVLDANVFFDLYSDDERCEESRALLADWLEPEAALCVTAELRNEISRQKVDEVRQERLTHVKEFECLEGTPAQVKIACDKIATVLPTPDCDSDESDRRQLAHAVAKNADYFVTRDALLLDHADEMRSVLEIDVVRPTDLLIRLHSTTAPNEYAPARLAGTQITYRLVGSEAEMLPFQQFGRREPKAAWLSLCRRVLGEPHAYETTLIAPEGAEPRVVYTLDRSDAGCLRVPIIRTLAHPLTATLVRRVLSELLVSAAENQRSLVKVCDHADVVVADALSALGFRHVGEYFAKATVPRITTRADAAPIAETHLPGVDLSETTDSEIERLLWPLKIADSRSPCFIIPIRAHWAAQLFDSALAEQDLFGADARRALALENVYYSASPVNIPAGARILWYVSKDGREAVQQIRGCSQCIETVRGPARQVFSRFSRLGIYRWPDVLRTAKGDAHAAVTAYRFAFTERFEKPIAWKRLQEVLERHTDAGNPIAGPASIPASVFFDLYSEATGRHA